MKSIAFEVLNLCFPSAKPMLCRVLNLCFADAKPMDYLY
ncbi:hypothetical protein EVA_11235 [gut metagenome]|uniref:Uncharacterized protein n=1 Tax=gut metagenome TaxID=749906 RepID=J9G0B3_9ZZZZ